MTFESLPPTVRNELNDVCDSFEAAMKAGQHPRIGAYLGERGEPERIVLFQMLLEIEVELRRGNDDHPSPGDYLEQYEAYTEVICTVFGVQGSKEAIVKASSLKTDPVPDLSPPVHMGSTALLPNLGAPDHRAPNVPASPGQPPGTASPASWPVPQRIGRYSVIRLLGWGNFLVYKARDDHDGRNVAIKVARPGDFTGRRRLMSLADEAEKLKALNHPRIVKLYEYIPAGETGVGADGYIVLEYVEGQTLETCLKAGALPVPRLVRIVTLIAEALHHAHTVGAGVVHRDVKPANILLDHQDQPHICDFGLALNEEVQQLRRGEVAGTPAYMAPEQVRGETPRLDCRTDIWALGVILYRGFTGKLPFPGRNQAEIFEEILHRDPRPPRMYDPGIDPELERICLRCLSRPMAERYLTASDLAADLKRIINERPPDRVSEPEAIVPKGLRPFDVEDARFFLALLPGPRRGDGMPESVRFWKDQVERVDSERVFRVGVLYGPSGGGKSSFVRAGLLPILDRSRVRSIYLEATPAGTESRLLAELRRADPILPPDSTLPEAIAILRDDIHLRSAGKLFIVLDQFEQWLQAHLDEPDAELVSALRQCDGQRVQALVLVRDDFWMALTRFLRALDVPLVQRSNAAAVELFDLRHTRKVLEGFGQALGQITKGGGPAMDEASHFLDEAARGLIGLDDRIIPVQLSLFIEVVRHRPWTRATLRALDGVGGIGVKFLDECFASTPYVQKRSASQAILKELLPPPTSAIRGTPRSADELRAASGYTDNPDEFAELVRVLDRELRLVIATGPESLTTAPQELEPTFPEKAGETSYQLAHDYLVRPIRQWLEREQGSTRKGRAKLRLELITASWLERPGSRQLPSLLEWSSILRHVPPGEWKADERRLMRGTARHYLRRGVVGLAFLVAVGLVVLIVRDHDHARNVFQRAIGAEPENLRKLLPEVKVYRGRLHRDLEQVEGNAAAPDRDRANAILMLHREWPTDKRAAALRARLTDAGPDNVGLIRDTLATDPSTAGVDQLARALSNEALPDAARLRAACALAGLAPVETKVWKPAASALIRGLLWEDRRLLPAWLALLDPAREILLLPLHEVCSDSTRDPTTRSIAAEALAWKLSTRHDAAGLARALTEAQLEASLILLQELARLNDKQAGLDYLRARLARKPDGPSDDQEFERQAMAAVALAVLDQPHLLRPALRHQVDPRLRTQTIQKIAASRLAPRLLHEQLPWADLDGAERQAVLLAWAETRLDAIPSAIRAGVLENAGKSLRDDADPGVHSAAELLIRRWKPDALPVFPSGTRQRTVSGARGWEAGPNGHTLVYLQAPLVFRMGSTVDDPDRYEYETPHECAIERSLLVATTETTVSQFRAFKLDQVQDRRYSTEPDCPVGEVSWYDALRYCNWLSVQAGLEPFFPEKVEPGMILPRDGRDRGGFRLPTETEWEYLCRAQTETRRPFGDTDRFFERYAWTWYNSRGRISPVGRLLPNEFGLFDMLGNQWEWCLDGPTGSELYPSYEKGSKDHPARDAFKNVPKNDADWRFVRGGCFNISPARLRAAHRDLWDAPNPWYQFGFRVVRTVQPAHDLHK